MGNDPPVVLLRPSGHSSQEGGDAKSSQGWYCLHVVRANGFSRNLDALNTGNTKPGLQPLMRTNLGQCFSGQWSVV